MCTVTGTSGSIIHSATVNVVVQDFTVTASPTSLNQVAGAMGSSTVTVAPVNGFSATVALTYSSTLGLSGCNGPTTASAGTATFTLSLSAATAQDYTCTVTGTSGSIIHSATVTVHVQGFTVTANPTILSLTPGVAGMSTVTVTAQNGFSTDVALTYTATPGLTGCAGPATATGGSATFTVTLSAATASDYLCTVSGAASGLSAMANITVHVQDFSVSANPTSIVVSQGSSNASIITVNSINGFSDAVTLTPSVPAGATGLTATLSITSITGGSGSSQLTISAGTGTPLGTFTVNVTGTSGSLTHQAQVQVTVVPFTQVIQQPNFIQVNWKHHLSLAKTGGVQTWKFGVHNNDTATTIFVQVEVKGKDGVGVTGFDVMSSVIQLAPLQDSTNNLVSFTFDVPGETWSFTAIIHWGTSATSLPFTSTASSGGVPTSGSFTVTP
jgi:hypothetical protein